MISDVRYLKYSHRYNAPIFPNLAQAERKAAKHGRTIIKCYDYYTKVFLGYMLEGGEVQSPNYKKAGE